VGADGVTHGADGADGAGDGADGAEDDGLLEEPRTPKSLDKQIYRIEIYVSRKYHYYVNNVFIMLGGMTTLAGTTAVLQVSDIEPLKSRWSAVGEPLECTRAC
jgi:hypothetical protein